MRERSFTGDLSNADSASFFASPAAALLAIDGHCGSGLLLTSWQHRIPGIAKVLYPMLVGNRLRLHAVPAFAGASGGLVVFGTSGVVLGPLVITVTLPRWGSSVQGLRNEAQKTRPK